MKHALEKKPVTPATIFRGDTPADLNGPYISQFLWQNIPYGAMVLHQQINTNIAGDDHMTTYSEWLNIQNGIAPSAPNQVDPTPRYIRNLRDLAAWVHTDHPYEAGLNAALFGIASVWFLHKLLAQDFGSILLGSSSGLESAHESEALSGSFFTHHLVAGLRGAADRNGDGEVTLGEVFAYAKELTVRDSVLQSEAPQHPSFLVNLSGRSHQQKC